jgi:chemotaxis protein MotB
VAVVKPLLDKGLHPTRVSAAGYGELQPRASNGDAGGRALNRRIEIIMLPDVQLLPDLAEEVGTPQAE